MKNKLNRILVTLDIILLIIPFIVRHFTNAKMGMMRHVTYKNEWFKNTVFTKNTINILIALLVIALIFNIYTIIKSKKIYLISSFIAILILTLSIIFIIVSSSTKEMSYYYFLLCMVVLVVIELIRNLYLNFKK